MGASTKPHFAHILHTFCTLTSFVYLGIEKGFACFSVTQCRKSVEQECWDCRVELYLTTLADKTKC